VLRRLQTDRPGTGAIMLSAFTAQGAETTLTCLELGAFDFVLKPFGSSLAENVERLRRELKPRLAAYARQRDVRRILGGAAPSPARGHVTPPSLPRPSEDRSAGRSSSAPAAREVVAIGISTGGPRALTELLPRLPGDLPVPVVIVQHMPPVFTKSLADDLDRRCRLRVYEAQQGQEVRAGEILIAPGGKQMKVCRESGRVVARLTDDPRENSCRPSVDYLFRSVASTYGGNTVAVLMTGMGSDGTAGARALKRCGALLVAQDEASCVVFGMPRALVEESLADVVAPLDRLAGEIVRLVEKGQPACV
jgi:two-component system, chemotaxis family, protein-glutamate methylesterase/glutaminase